jgi:hypothetical protein
MGVKVRAVGLGSGMGLRQDLRAGEYAQELEALATKKVLRELKAWGLGFRGFGVRG